VLSKQLALEFYSLVDKLVLESSVDWLALVSLVDWLVVELAVPSMQLAVEFLVDLLVAVLVVAFESPNLHKHLYPSMIVAHSSPNWSSLQKNHCLEHPHNIQHRHMPSICIDFDHLHYCLDHSNICLLVEMYHHIDSLYPHKCYTNCSLPHWQCNTF